MTSKLQERPGLRVLKETRVRRVLPATPVQMDLQPMNWPLATDSSELKPSGLSRSKARTEQMELKAHPGQLVLMGRMELMALMETQELPVLQVQFGEKEPERRPPEPASTEITTSTMPLGTSTKRSVALIP